MGIRSPTAVNGLFFYTKKREGETKHEKENRKYPVKFCACGYHAAY